MNKKKTDKPQHPAKDKAGTGQSDAEKGIASEEEQRQKQADLLHKGKARKRPQFNGSGKEDPVQLEPDT